jgi:hypothetical protein
MTLDSFGISRTRILTIHYYLLALLVIPEGPNVLKVLKFLVFRSIRSGLRNWLKKKKKTIKVSR